MSLCNDYCLWQSNFSDQGGEHPKSMSISINIEKTIEQHDLLAKLNIVLWLFLMSTCHKLESSEDWVPLEELFWLFWLWTPWLWTTSFGNSPDKKMSMTKERLTLFFCSVGLPSCLWVVPVIVGYEDDDSFAATTRNSRLQWLTKDSCEHFWLSAADQDF